MATRSGQAFLPSATDARRNTAPGYLTPTTLPHALDSHDSVRLTLQQCIHLAAANSLLVCADNAGAAPLIANRTAVGAWESFDPTILTTTHGPYTGVAGWFAVSDPNLQTVHRDGTVGVGAPPTDGEDAAQGGISQAASYLCALASSNGIECSVVAEPTKHDWQSGAQQFANALPWLAGRIGTPCSSRRASMSTA